MLKHFWYQDTIVVRLSLYIKRIFFVLTHELRFNQQFNSKFQHATINHDHQMLREIGENDIIIYDIKAMEKKGWWLVNGPELGRLLIIISYFFHHYILPVHKRCLCNPQFCGQHNREQTQYGVWPSYLMVLSQNSPLWIIFMCLYEIFYLLI